MCGVPGRTPLLKPLFEAFPIELKKRVKRGEGELGKKGMWRWVAMGERERELGLVDASSDSSSSVCKGTKGEEARMNLLIPGSKRRWLQWGRGIAAGITALMI
ncbi:unnamed protein product [Prunus armeniaca]|uniref:Uncharacterized protein n=1 Tax=Prunus armeniaca TaxID=36596 RepID=A0A6J5UP26_PRUAR|nr:unnamed protein product [Prunus armeniaca]